MAPIQVHCLEMLNVHVVVQTLHQACTQAAARTHKAVITTCYLLFIHGGGADAIKEQAKQ